MSEEKQVPEKSSLAAAVLGLIGGSAAAAVVTIFASSSVEREKFSYAIIQQALEADVLEDRVSRLQFLIDMGFVSDVTLRTKLEGRIKASSVQPPIQKLPQLPAAYVAQGAPTAPSPAARPFVMATPNKEKEMKELVTKLMSLGFRATGDVFPDPTLVSRLGDKVIVRYFFEQDEMRARLLAETLGWAEPDAASVAKFVPGVTNRTPGYIEIWLGS